MNKFLFEESQKFRQIWLWAILILTLGSIVGILIFQLATGQKVGSRPAPNIFLIILTVILVIPTFLGFYFSELTTKIDNEGIYYGWNTLSTKLNFIPWSKIRNAKIIKYKFVGYGYKITSTYGIIYNVSGNKGLLIEKDNGDKLLIGTKKPDELKRIIDNLPQKV